jgi:hypothetical protein
MLLLLIRRNDGLCRVKQHFVITTCTYAMASIPGSAATSCLGSSVSAEIVGRVWNGSSEDNEKAIYIIYI